MGKFKQLETNYPIPELLQRDIDALQIVVENVLRTDIFTFNLDGEVFTFWVTRKVMFHNDPVRVLADCLVVNGEDWNPDGYLDIGIADTMKDLMVNFIRAMVFSIIGIIY